MAFLQHQTLDEMELLGERWQLGDARQFYRFIEALMQPHPVRELSIVYHRIRAEAVLYYRFECCSRRCRGLVRRQTDSADEKVALRYGLLIFALDLTKSAILSNLSKWELLLHLRQVLPRQTYMRALEDVARRSPLDVERVQVIAGADGDPMFWMLNNVL